MKQTASAELSSKAQAASAANKLTSGRETRPQVFYCHDPRHKAQVANKQADKAQVANKQAGVGGTRPQVFSGPATLCHIDKMFLNLGPAFSHTGTRLTLMKLHDA